MSVIIVSWKRSKVFTILAIAMYIIAIYFVFFAFTVTSIELKIAVGSLSIVFASIAFSGIRDMADKQKIDQILDKLSKIEDLQKEIQSEQKEQKEQGSSRQPIIASIEAFTKFYMGYMAKRKEGEDEKS